jgi:iron complex outermembrane receptor protein
LIRAAADRRSSGHREETLNGDSPVVHANTSSTPAPAARGCAIAGCVILLAQALAAVPTVALAQDTASNADSSDSLDEVLIQATKLGLDTPNDTGSRLNLPARELPFSVSAVSQGDMQLYGARTVNDAIEAIVGVTGGFTSGSIPYYGMRGFTGNDVSVMHDGIRQNTASQSARPLDTFTLSSVQVLKGPSSVIYGEGAVGGAVNYVSKSPDSTPQAEALLSYGSWNSTRIAAGAGGPTGVQNLNFRLDASDNSTDGYVANNRSEYRAVAGSLGWQPSANTGVTWYEDYLQDSTQNYYGTPVVYDAVINATTGVKSVSQASAAIDRLVNARLDPATLRLNYDSLDNFVHAENSFSRLVVDQRFGEHWSLSNEVYVATQHLNWRNTENYTWNPATQLVHRSSFLIIWRQDQQLGDQITLTLDAPIAGRANQLLIGGVYDDNHQGRNSGQTGYPSSPTPADVPLTGFDEGLGPDASYMKTVEVITKTSAAYAEDVFQPLPALKLVGGVRYDHIDLNRISYIGAAPFSTTYNPLTVRWGILYDLTPKLNVYASYGRAAQPVSQLVSLTASQADFALQTARQYEVGSKASFWHDTANVTLALYDIAKQHILTSNVVDGVIYNSEIGKQVSQGSELAFAFAPTNRWRVDFNFAWTWKAEYKEFFANTSAGVLNEAGNTPPNVPKVVAGLFVNHQWRSWSGNTGLRYVGTQQANTENYIQIPAYVVWDAAVSYHWSHLMATLRGRNLTDKVYAEQSAGNGLMFYLGEPRNVELGLDYKF